VEAFAVDTPVLTSSVSSMQEIAGEAALLVNPRRTDEIAGALLRLCLDQELRENLALKGRERVRSFSWERCARETAAVYSE